MAVNKPGAVSKLTNKIKTRNQMGYKPHMIRHFWVGWIRAHFIFNECKDIFGLDSKDYTLFEGI
jgi:hypothetical protein